MAKMNCFVPAIAAAFIATCLPVSVFAHSTSATMDASGTSATFTGLGQVTCFNDGSGAPAMLIARIRDKSAPVAGLLVNLQLLKDSAAISITDPVSGDANPSEYIALPGGAGDYTIMVNKTAAGPRTFDLDWHCMTADNQHTGTEIIVRQFK